MMIYPENLSPNASEMFEIKGQSIMIPKCKVDLMKWAGTPLSYTFGGKPIVDYEGIPMFAEMAILNSFRDSGWDARWVETYGKPRLAPIYLLEWIDKDYKSQVHAPIDHKMVNMLLQLVAKENGNNFGGCWDVLAWKLDETVAEILNVIERKSNTELYGVSWYEKWTLGRMIQFNTASPYTNARVRIRKWKKERNIK